MTDAAELIARIRANVDELQTGMQQADAIVKQGAATLNETAKTTGTGMGSNLSTAFADSSKQIIGAINSISPALGSIVTAVGPVGIAIAVVTADVEAFKTAWDLAEIGAQTAEIASHFTTLTGGISASEEMMQKLRQATKGTVEDAQLMIIANKAINEGITTNADTMSQLAAVFKYYGEAGGVFGSQAITQGMQALGVLQTRGLKSIGISLDDTKIYDAYAEKLGIVASKLDDVQKRAALTEAILALAPTGLADSAASAADKAEAMHVAIKNLNISIGESIKGMLSLGGVVTDVANAASESLNRKLTSQEIIQPYMDYRETLSVLSPANWKLIADMDMVRKSFEQGKISVEEYELILHSLAPSVESADYEMRILEQSDYLAASSLGVFAFNAMDAENKARSLAGAIAFVSEQTAYYNRMSSTYNAPGGYPSGSTIPADIQLGTGGAPVGMTSSWGTPTKVATGGSSGSGGGGNALADAQRQASDMRSLIESILTPTDVTSQDMAATKAGTYADKWDEYARKMRAIANDQKSVWRDMVPKDILAQGEDAIKGWAAQQEKMFYSGQMPDKLDKNALIQSAKDMVAQQQARETMIQTVGGWLSEAGIGTVQAADLLGLNTPGAQIGTDAAKSFAQGTTDTDVGLSVTTAFGDSIKASAKTWESYGAVAIGYFIGGGKAGITPDIGATFAALLWPYFKAIIDRENPLP